MMRLLRELDLRHRLQALTAATVSAVLLAACASVYLIVRDELRDNIDQALLDTAARVEFDQVAPAPEAMPAEQVTALPIPPPPVGGTSGYVQLVDLAGNATGTDGGPGKIPVTDLARRAARGLAAPTLTDMDIRGVHSRVLTMPVAPGVALQAARPLDEVDEALGDIALVLAGVGAAGVVAALLFARLVASSALGPVRRLTEAAEHVTTTGDLARRVEAPGHDELHRLARSFNAMLDALEASVTAQKRLVADASHELRTPLTSIRTNVEVLERAHALEPAERARIVSDVTAQLEELTELVADIVELARDPSPVHEPVEVHLDELAQRCVDVGRRRWPGIAFELRTQPATVTGDPARLERAVTNLLDNAAKWSPPDGTVEVEVGGEAISVRDHGPGIAEDDLPRIFDRFYRADSARGLPGSGLGLAIVKDVAAAHGAEVEAGNAPGGGALLRLRFPASALS